MKLSEENKELGAAQPMREASLIELIEMLPKSHLARREYTDFLGRLSCEKNERLSLEQEKLEMQQRIQELEDCLSDLVDKGKIFFDDNYKEPIRLLNKESK